MHLQPAMKRVVFVLAVVAALALCPIWLIAQQTPVPWPQGVTAPVFVIPASAMNGSGTLTVSCVTYPSGTILCEDAANVLALRNGVNSQTFRLYHTYTNASTYQRWGLDATTSGTFKLAYGLNGAAATYPMTLTSTGALTTLGIGVFGSGGIYAKTSTNNDISVGASNRYNIDLVAAGDVNWTSASDATSPTIDTGLSRASAAVVKATNGSTGYGVLDAGGLRNSGTLMVSSASPTIVSGFGSTPGIVANNGTAAFTISVGTGGTASSGIVGLPTATTGWHVVCDDITTPASFVTDQTTTSVGSVTLTNYSRTLGTLVAWTASDVLVCSAMAY